MNQTTDFYNGVRFFVYDISGNFIMKITDKPKLKFTTYKLLI